MEREGWRERERERASVDWFNLNVRKGHDLAEAEAKVQELHAGL